MEGIERPDLLRALHAEHRIADTAKAGLGAANDLRELGRSLRGGQRVVGVFVIAASRRAPEGGHQKKGSCPGRDAHDVVAATRAPTDGDAERTRIPNEELTLE